MLQGKMYNELRRIIFLNHIYRLLILIISVITIFYIYIYIIFLCSLLYYKS